MIAACQIVIHNGKPFKTNMFVGALRKKYVWFDAVRLTVVQEYLTSFRVLAYSFYLRFVGTNGHGLVQRICIDRLDAPARVLECSIHIFEKRSCIAISKDASFDCILNPLIVSPPPWYIARAVQPLFNRITYKPHELLFCSDIAALCQTHQTNADKITQLSISMIDRNHKNVKLYRYLFKMASTSFLFSYVRSLLGLHFGLQRRWCFQSRTEVTWSQSIVFQSVLMFLWIKR